MECIQFSVQDSQSQRHNYFCLLQRVNHARAKTNGIGFMCCLLKKRKHALAHKARVEARKSATPEILCMNIRWGHEGTGNPSSFSYLLLFRSISWYWTNSPFSCHSVRRFSDCFISAVLFTEKPLNGNWRRNLQVKMANTTRKIR